MRTFDLATARQWSDLRAHVVSVGLPSRPPTEILHELLIWKGDGLDLDPLLDPPEPRLELLATVLPEFRIGEALFFAHPFEHGRMICVDWNLQPRRIRVSLLDRKDSQVILRVLARVLDDLEQPDGPAPTAPGLSDLPDAS